MFIVILQPKASERWELYGPFDSSASAGLWAKDYYRAGDKRRWMVIPLQDAADRIPVGV